MSQSKNTLPCGCRRGEYLCPEAVRLWNEVNRDYELCYNKPTSDYRWDDYDKALEAYNRHFGETKLQIVCAWCGKPLGEKDGHGTTGVSHGICEECHQKIKRQRRLKDGC